MSFTDFVDSSELAGPEYLVRVDHNFRCKLLDGHQFGIVILLLALSRFQGFGSGLFIRPVIIQDRYQVLQVCLQGTDS